jgi:hypothetical protein
MKEQSIVHDLRQAMILATSLAGILGVNKQKMLDALTYNIEHIDEERFKATFRHTSL